MDDKTVLDHINQLADEEHRLFQKEPGNELSREERARLSQIGVTLDRCWDLLRQRRALRSAGRSPDEAEPRDERTVERYTG